jgi:hypothetical protein
MDNPGNISSRVDCEPTKAGDAIQPAELFVSVFKKAVFKENVLPVYICRIIFQLWAGVHSF